VLESIHREIVQPLRQRFPDAGLEVDWRILLSAVLEVLGEDEGLALLERESAERRDRTERPGPSATDPDGPVEAAVPRFVSSVLRHGFLPARIRIAARRYRRWAQLNPNATLEAQAATLDQIESAYGLGELEEERPGARLQFFRHTVFRRASDDFTRAFDQVIAATRTESSSRAEWHEAIAALREAFPLSDRQEFFLARVLYPHVDPRGRAVLTREEDDATGFATGVEVEHVDPKGDPFRIRRPTNPHEINALYRVFARANFRQMPTAGQEDFLVVTDTAGRVIGGLIFRRMSDEYVRLEWIVVARHRRGRGIGSVLLREFLQRLAAEGVRTVSTGFFRPSLFAKFGFGVDPRYAGIVRFLQTDRPSGAGGFEEES
jgi:GNAT superfamily N-acetyltransferase